MGKDADLTLEEPKETLGNTEFALRLLGQFQSYELALYGFKGFFHSPVGVKDPLKRELFYPKLNVYGASVRGPVLGGIANMEMGYYDSREDRAGGIRSSRTPPSSTSWAMNGSPGRISRWGSNTSSTRC